MMQIKQKLLHSALFFSVMIGAVSESIPLGSDEERNDAGFFNVGTRTRSARKLKKSKNSKQSNSEPSTCAITTEEIAMMQAMEDQVISEYDLLEFNILGDGVGTFNIFWCIDARWRAFFNCAPERYFCMLAGLKTCEFGFEAICQPDSSYWSNCTDALFDARDYCNCPSLLKP